MSSASPGRSDLEQGYRPIEDVIPMLERATVGVVPIVDDPFTKYMLPVKLLEYVALGMPVIASSTPTIRAYFSDEMLAFYAPGDADALARPDRRAVSRSGQAVAGSRPRRTSSPINTTGRARRHGTTN